MANLDSLNTTELQIKLASNLLEQTNIIDIEIDKIRLSKDSKKTYTSELADKLEEYNTLLTKAQTAYESSISNNRPADKIARRKQTLINIPINYNSSIEKIKNKYIEYLKENNEHYKMLTIEENTIKSMLDSSSHNQASYLKGIQYDYKYLKYKTKYLE